MIPLNLFIPHNSRNCTDRTSIAIHRVWSALLAILLLPLSAFAQTPPLLPPQGYYRQPAIHGDTVVFVAEGDLWRANINSAAMNAVRLTTHLAEETLPRISPDGKLVAFTARYEGPAEVYVMPLTGGLPTRLTYDGDNARVQGFTPDGRVLYTTARYSGKPDLRMFAIDVATRMVKPLPLAEAAEGCYAGTEFMFTREPLGSDNVKNYRGGLVQNIWRFDGKAEATLLTRDYAGTSRQPMCGASRIFFLSDRDMVAGKSSNTGTMNVWSMNRLGGDIKQHTMHREFDIRSANISPDGARIVYQRGADIHLLNTVSNEDRALNITLQSDFEQTRLRWVKTPWDFVTAVEPSPTGDRVAVTARGEIFIFPVGNGRRVELLKDANTRAREAIFAADGKSVFAFSDKTGEFELTRYPANGVGAPTTMTQNASVLRYRAYPSPDGKWVAHADAMRKLYVTDTTTNVTREIDRNAYEEYQNIAWSPDSRYLSFKKNAANQFDQLYLLEVANATLTLITSDRYDARDAAFSPDGKWLFFLANRNLQSVVAGPWGQRNPQPFFDRQTKIYAYALAAESATMRWPFLARDELQIASPPADAAKAEAKLDTKADTKAPTAKVDTPKPIVPIALEGIRDRLYEVPVPAGNYRELSTDGKRLFFLSLDPIERKTALRTVAIEAPNPAPPTVDTFMDDIRSYRMTQDRKKLMIRRQNDVFVFDVAKSAPPPAEQSKFQVNTRDWMIQIDPRQEWQQLFVDAWRMHRDFFYDKNMHGADWVAVRARYQPLLKRVTDRAELSDVMAQMVSEVRALHSQVGAPDIRRGQDTIDIGGLGAEFEKTANGFRVAKLLGGDPELIEERGPLARAEVNVRVGDIIVAINGNNAANAASIGELLRNQADKQVLLQVQKPDGKRRDVIATPIDPRRERELRYLTWERERMMQVESASQNRIGYVHLQAMGVNDIARWTREFYPVYQRDGLIIDLRNNNGGNIDSWIIEKLQRRVWHFWQSRRNDEPFGNQQVTFRGHVVALIDANTYSDGETMAQGLRRLGIAPLVGKTTAGAGIWLSDINRLRDNGIARAAEFGSFVDNGRERAWITEGAGVAPDIEVDNLPFETYKGKDAQLERAIALLQEKIAKEPVVKPVVPTFPVLNRP
jgi:tricorn protease